MRQLSLLLLLSVAMLCSASTLRVKRDVSIARKHCPQVRDRTECLSTIDSRWTEAWLGKNKECVWCIRDCADGNVCEPRGFLEGKGKRAGNDFETGVMMARKFQGKLYVHVARKANFAEAENWCNQHGMKLATINNSDENEFIMELGWDNKPTGSQGTANGYPWIGLKKEGYLFCWRPHCTSLWRKYTNWYPDEPNRSGDCVFLSSYNGKWLDAPCSQDRTFVCSK